MGDDCPFCPQITIAVHKFNKLFPFNSIEVIDVNSISFKIYEERLAEIEESTRQPFGTPTIEFDGVYIIGEFDWRGVLELLTTLHYKEDEYEQDS